MLKQEVLLLAWSNPIKKWWEDHNEWWYDFVFWLTGTYSSRAGVYTLCFIAAAIGSFVLFLAMTQALPKLALERALWLREFFVFAIIMETVAGIVWQWRNIDIIMATAACLAIASLATTVFWALERTKNNEEVEEYIEENYYDES